MAKILFLDDEERILNTYKRMLHSTKVEGFYAKNSEEAIKIIKAVNIDLIMSDYRLEQETGLDFLKYARKNGINVPMIIISGYAEENFIKSAMELNIVQDYLVKPVGLDIFKKLIMKFLPGEIV